MLQKRNDFEIINIINKSPSHIREISTKLNIIPSTTMRTLKKLESNRIVDFKIEGKNKRYFLKNTIEAKIYLNMVEDYRLLNILENIKIRRIIKEIKEITNNELIILFGSYAKNKENKNSDIDVYIETNNRNLKNKLSSISKKLSVKIGTFNKDNLLIKEIIKDHIILQNKDRYFELLA